MSSQKDVQLGAHAIMWAVMNKRSEVVALLLKNGVVTPTGASDMQVAQLVKSLLKGSKSFRVEFFDLLATSHGFSQSYTSMNGEFSNASGGVADSSLNLTTAIGTDTPKKSWFTSENIQNTLNTGLNAFLALDKNKTDRALAQASQNVAMYNAQQGGGTTAGVPSGTKSNTTMYVVLGVVVVGLVGGLVYFATKNK